MDYIYKAKYVYYTKEGNGEPVILLHGWGMSSKTFIDTINLLKQKYTVYAIDLPGFGKSSEPDNAYRLYEYVQLLNNFISDKNIIKPIIAGHSFGGRIAIKYASLTSNIHKLILIDSAGLKPKHHWLTNFKILKYKLLKKWYRITKNVMGYNNLIKNSGSNDYKQASLVMKKTLSNVVSEFLNTDLKKIKVETLIIWGANDTVTPFRDALKLRRKIKNSGLVVLDDVGHFSYLEARKKYLAIISNYLGVNNDN